MAANKNGFSFGVVLGAVIGTGAMILSETNEGKKIRKQMINKLHELKDEYPEQAQKIEDVMSTALQEAQSLTSELKNISSLTEPKKTPSKKTKKATRTFTRSD